jgi:hypothetical protein
MVICNIINQLHRACGGCLNEQISVNQSGQYLHNVSAPSVYVIIVILIIIKNSMTYIKGALHCVRCIGAQTRKHLPSQLETFHQDPKKLTG